MILSLFLLLGSLISHIWNTCFLTDQSIHSVNYQLVYLLHCFDINLSHPCVAKATRFNAYSWLLTLTFCKQRNNFKKKLYFPQLIIQVQCFCYVWDLTTSKSELNLWSARRRWELDHSILKLHRQLMSKWSYLNRMLVSLSMRNSF